ncbi:MULTISPECIES: glycosyltransferase family 2 protein [Providencia]|uniref:Glycosyltransferase family 2 protein n=2 Tax=Providencia rettgeri TaxID=587 RepID=A0AB35LEN3_PRORE|nr:MULTISPECIES: glycosyltransferase family 2 protein [Providencia]MBG5901976.1 glycosyltransferase family 2 protein [Providencia rettgeri]MDH2306834.1 glycosyltransferase family 2 protein [Providencia rettgeri]
MNKETISIAVFSYNSEGTILETLNSIQNQDYGSQFIELLFGDDGSKDNTQKIIMDWLAIHGSSFHNIIVNMSSINKGVVANFNSTCKLATSGWIKPIAADDLLAYNCISEFYSFVIKNETPCAFCKVQKFTGEDKLEILPKNNYYFSLSAQDQFENLLIDNFIPAPGCFLKVSLLQYIGYAEENLCMEDYPMWLKIAAANIQMPLLNKTLVQYRIGNSLSKNKYKLTNPILDYDTYQVKKRFLSKLNKNKIVTIFYKIEISSYKLSNLIKVKLFRNKKNRVTHTISLFSRLMSPIFTICKIKSKIK